MLVVGAGVPAAAVLVVGAPGAAAASEPAAPRALEHRLRTGCTAAVAAYITRVMRIGTIATDTHTVDTEIGSHAARSSTLSQ